MTTPQHQEDAQRQMRDALQDEFLEMRVASYVLSEDLESGHARVSCDLRVGNADPIEVTGEGVGVIDAVFAALKNRYAPEYPSLDSIRFSSFSVRGLMDDSGGSHADAKAEISGHSKLTKPTETQQISCTCLDSSQKDC